MDLPSGERIWEVGSVLGVETRESAVDGAPYDRQTYLELWNRSSLGDVRSGGETAGPTLRVVLVDLQESRWTELHEWPLEAQLISAKMVSREQAYSVAFSTRSETEKGANCSFVVYRSTVDGSVESERCATVQDVEFDEQGRFHVLLYDLDEAQLELLTWKGELDGEPEVNVLQLSVRAPQPMPLLPLWPGVAALSSAGGRLFVGAFAKEEQQLAFQSLEVDRPEE